MLEVTLLGTNGGPPPLAGRFGISSALVVNGATYVVDCGRGAVSQYVRAGLSMPSLTAIFLTHLHADHTVDYFSFPLLAGGASGTRGFSEPIGVYGPGPSGHESGVAGAPGPVPGTVEMTRLANRAFAAHTTFFSSEHFGVDPASMVDVHDVLPPASVGASLTETAPPMEPFVVMTDDNVRVSAVLVPHGAVFPAYAYRFDTAHGSVVFSGDTARSDNLGRLAHRADLLVHEAAAAEALPALGLRPALLEHIRDVHTDVADLGAIAVAADVGAVVVNHLSPGALAAEEWQSLIDRSRENAGFRGEMILGEDLMRIPVSARAAR
ncbi:MBL fold metallo-hydrolase [Cryptosporangium minutisporangium]|uniref:MBL fold metallo-hydrolase n=1 Tax=Cryptosporangium minutisporangium TaxID=113569 RepID=UPI0031EA6198